MSFKTLNYRLLPNFLNLLSEFIPTSTAVVAPVVLQCRMRNLDSADQLILLPFSIPCQEIFFENYIEWRLTFNVNVYKSVQTLVYLLYIRYRYVKLNG